MNKKGINVLGMSVIIIFGTLLILVFDGITSSIAAGATVEKIDDALILSCKYTLHNLVGTEYFREATPVGNLPTDEVFLELVEYYGLPIEYKSEWELRRDIIRKIPAFSNLGDLYLCYQIDCLEQGWVERFNSKLAAADDFDMSIACASRVYGPYRNDEVVLYLLDK